MNTMIITRKKIQQGKQGHALTALVAVGLALVMSLGLAVMGAHKTGAASLANWDAGRIMDDVIFTDKSTMNTGQIQSFLNSKVPSFVTGCPAPHALASSYHTPDPSFWYRTDIFLRSPGNAVTCAD